MTYDEQLKDQRWLDLRQVIFERDLWVCQNCLSGKILQVHHKYYLDGKMAWDYPHDALITLCKKCHAHEHGKGFIPPPVFAPGRTPVEYGYCRPVRSIREVMVDAIREQLRMLHNG